MNSPKLLLSVFVLTSLVFLSSCTVSDGRSSQKESTPASQSNTVVETSLSPSRANATTATESVTPTTTIETPAVSVPVKMSTTTATPPKNTTPTVTPSSSTVTQASTKATTKSVTYSTDRGKERVTASFTIKTDATGKILSASASAISADRESQQYIRRFNSAAASQIVGKKISSLSLSAVGGASDTTDAFLQVVSGI